MKTIVFFMLSFSVLFLSAQEDLNLDFEQIENGMPSDWQSFGSDAYTISLDSADAHQGKYAVSISYEGDNAEFHAWSYSIPAKYAGKKIKLTGYIKTENVREGWAGLWLRLDPGVGFDNMQKRGITGTTDWKQYEVVLELKPDETQQIVFGGLLVGKGKMWLDDLNITIGGAELSMAEPIPLKPAEVDSAFDAGSGITFPDIDERLLTDLELMGKVWGFLKYHHPALAKGDYNWDYELFRILPKYLKNETAAQRDQILQDWIASYGEVPICTSCKPLAEDAFLKPDLDWIRKGKMSEELKKILLYIYKNRHQGPHYYIGIAPNIGNPQFKNEDAYANMPYPDEGFRLLSVYKYWNMIQYFFPYKHLMDKDWSPRLKYYIPEFLEAENELEYELAAVHIIGDVQDTHADLWGGDNAIEDWKGAYYPPIQVRFVEGKLMVHGYTKPELKDQLGLNIGDIIVAIDGKSIEKIVEERTHYYPASNEPTRLRNIAADILRSNNPSIKISYAKGGIGITRTLALYSKESLNFSGWYESDGNLSYKFLNDSIGYITLRSIRDEDIPVIKDTFRNTKGIVIDIRNYPSTFVVFSLGSYFLDDTTAFVKFTQGSVNHPGEFTFTEDLRIPNDPNPYQGKVVVIVNELTQSQAEYTSMAFRASDRTTVIGSTTAGADGNISPILLPGGLRTVISGIGVYYPNGGETQRVGIVPDVEILPTIEGIRNGKDELVEKAIELINENP